jgi:hypothetical protein
MTAEGADPEVVNIGATGILAMVGQAAFMSISSRAGGTSCLAQPRGHERHPPKRFLQPQEAQLHTLL